MNTKQYITAITYIILLRITDLGLTFIYTPDLRYEWNPIVSVFNYSWIGMLITQILIICLIIAVMSFYFKKKPIIPAWLSRKAVVGRIERLPKREDLDQDIHEQLIVELYSR